MGSNQMIAAVGLLLCGCQGLVSARQGTGPATSPSDAGSALTVTPGPLDFGVVDVASQSAPSEIRVRADAGAVRDVSLASLGSGGDFAIETDCVGRTLETGETCVATVWFKPRSFGGKRLEIVIGGQGVAEQRVDFEGTGRDRLRLDVLREGDGGGKVTGEGIDCGATCSTLVERTDALPTVRLTATPDEQSQFAGWTGCSSVDGTACSVSLLTSTHVVARFEPQGTPMLTIRVESAAGSSGRVTGDGIDCGVRCSRTGEFHEQVTLIAEPGPGARLLEWSGACSGSQRTCTLQMAGSQVVVARFRRGANLAFVTSEAWEPWELNGLSGADAACQRLAQRAGLEGTFVAWLSTSTVNAMDRLRLGSGSGAQARGWVRVDGKPFVDSIADLTAPAPKVFYPLRMDETGRDLEAQSGPVMTGTLPDGRRDPSQDLTCGDWTSRTGWLAYGVPLMTSSHWSHYSTETCVGTKFRLYCFETSYAVLVAPGPPPAQGRLAFLSSVFSYRAGGRGELDAQCQNEARSAGLSNRKFRALVAQSGTALLDDTRFDFDGHAWFRPDRVQVFEGRPGEALLAPIAVLVNGDRVADTATPLAWTGVGSAGDVTSAGGPDTTCQNWHSMEGAATRGFANSSGWFTLARFPQFRADGWYLQSGTYCGADARVYCLETGN